MSEDSFIIEILKEKMADIKSDIKVIEFRIKSTPLKQKHTVKQCGKWLERARDKVTQLKSAIKRLKE